MPTISASSVRTGGRLRVPTGRPVAMRPASAQLRPRRTIDRAQLDLFADKDEVTHTHRGTLLDFIECRMIDVPTNRAQTIAEQTHAPGNFNCIGSRFNGLGQSLTAK